MIKKFTLLSLSATVVASSAMAQIPNSSFETWELGNPTGWTTGNTTGYISVEQSTNAYDAMYSAKLQVVSGFGISVGGAIISNNFPETISAEALHGWYKSNFVDGDGLLLSTSLQDANDNIIAAGSNQLYANAAVWTEFVSNMDVLSASTPDNGSISILLVGPSGSATAVHSGSYAEIDDLSWGDAVVSIEETGSAEPFVLETIFPNPTVDGISMVQFQLNQPAQVQVEVYDMLGQLVQLDQLGNMPSGHYRSELNTATWTAGIYVVRLIVDGQVRTMQLIK